MASNAKKWLTRITAFEKPAARLVCFPFGGGGAGFFWEWRSAFPSDVELWAVCLPGRENRVAEEYVTDAAAVVDGIADELTNLDSRPLAFYGHSLGAGLAVQTAHLLCSKRAIAPRLLILSGRLPPHRLPPTYANSPDEELSAHLLRLGGIPRDILEEQTLLKLYLPRIRADFALSDALPREPMPAIESAIVVVNGADDPIADSDALQEWRGYTNAEFRSYTLPGGHFFIRESSGEFMKLLDQELAQVARNSGAQVETAR